MKLLWEDRAWDDYLYWQAQDKKRSNVSTALSKISREVLLTVSANQSR